MEVVGKVHLVNAETKVSDSFKKRELVIATDEQYPQFISINFVQDKCDLLNEVKKGQDVKVGINLRGREWVNPQGESKYFNDIQGWRVEKQTASTTADLKPKKEVFETTTAFEVEDQNDLPF
jgi:translation initiation factor IF-3